MSSALETSVEVSPSSLPVQRASPVAYQDETSQKINSMISRIEEPGEYVLRLVSSHTLDVEDNTPSVQETDLGEYQGETLQKVESVISQVEDPTRETLSLTSSHTLDVNDDTPHFCKSKWMKKFETPITCCLLLFSMGVVAAIIYGVVTAIISDLKSRPSPWPEE